MKEHKSFLTYFAQAVEQYHADRRTSQSPDANVVPPTRARRVFRWLIPNGGTILLALLLILTQNVWAKPLQNALNAPGPSATTVNYQGRLADSSGNPKDGTFGMTFAFYDADTGGSPVWGPESHAAVPVSDGLFSVGLGSQTSGGIPTSVWNGDRYLEITVGGETLSPRELIRSVPVAGMALTVPDGAIGTEQIADRAVVLSKLSTDAKVSVSQAVGGAMPVGTTETTVVQSTVTLANTSSVLIMINSRAVSTEPNDEFYFHIYRDDIPITNNIHLLGVRGGHQFFCYSLLDTNVPPGTHTYKFTAAMHAGDGTRYIHQPSIITISIP